MRIAFISTYNFAIPGGVKSHIIDLANELMNQGNKAYILAPSSEPTITDRIQNFIQIAHFPSASKTGFIPPHFLISPRVIVRLQTILNAEAFDIVHIHEPLIPPLCLSALMHKKTPLFATFHTYYEKGQPFYRLFQPVFNAWLSRLQGRIVVSNSAKNYIERYFPYDYKIIPNGVSVEKFSTSAPILPELTQGYFNLLFVGHAQFRRKGLKYLLEAYRILKPDYPKLRLIIAGSQWSGRSRPKALADFKVADVLYLGMVTEEALIALYQAADIFCAPSLGNESFGIVLLEAMAAGTPVVTTNIDGYRNVVHDDQEALVVPPKNSIVLAGAIKRLMDDSPLRQRLVEKAQISVQQYSWKKVASDVMDYYLEKMG